MNTQKRPITNRLKDVTSALTLLTMLGVLYNSPAFGQIELMPDDVCHDMERGAKTTVNDHSFGASCDFDGKNLDGYIITNSLVLEDVFMGATLTGAQITTTTFNWVAFRDTNLKGVDFTGSTFCKTLVMTVTEGTNVVVDTFHKECGLRGFSFSGKDLTGTNFTNADLQSVDFTNANLTNVNFQGANLTGAKFTGATLNATNFSDASMEGVIKTLDESLACVASYSHLNTCDWNHWSEIYQNCQTHAFPEMDSDDFLLNQVKDGNCAWSNWTNLYKQIKAR